MAHLLRLALAALLALFALSANAFEAWSVSFGDRVGRGTSAADACSQLIGAKHYGTTGVNTVNAASMDGDLCNYTYTSSWGAGYNGGGTVVPTRGPDTPCANPYHIENGGACVPRECNPNQVRVNGFCVDEPPCDPGYTRVNGRCVKNKCPQAGSGAGEGWEMSSPSTEYACIDQGISFDGPVMYCAVRVVNNMDMVIDGKRFYYGTGKYTGGTCTPGTGGGTTGGDPGTGGGTGGNTGGGTGGTGGNTGGGTGGTGGGDGGGGGGGGTGPKPPNPDSPPMPTPPTGTPPDTNGTCPPGTSKAANGGCYAPTPPPTPPDSDGACPSGYVKVGQVCVAPSPPTGPFDDTSNSGNPGDGEGEGDGEKSGFGGACMSGFSCEGDAIQCAIAQEQHRRACKLFDDESAESKLYQDNKGKEGKQTNDLPGNEAVSFLGRISTNDLFGGGGQCTNDVNVVVMGQAITLPFTKICPAIAVIGNIMVAVSLLLAARILTRG